MGLVRKYFSDYKLLVIKISTITWKKSDLFSCSETPFVGIRTKFPVLKDKTTRREFIWKVMSASALVSPVFSLTVCLHLSYVVKENISLWNADRLQNMKIIRLPRRKIIFIGEINGTKLESRDVHFPTLVLGMCLSFFWTKAELNTFLQHPHTHTENWQVDSVWVDSEQECRVWGGGGGTCLLKFVFFIFILHSCPNSSGAI